jgi:hypothetical protein
MPRGQDGVDSAFPVTLNLEGGCARGENRGQCGWSRRHDAIYWGPKHGLPGIPPGQRICGGGNVAGRRCHPGFGGCGFEFRPGCDSIGMHPGDAAGILLSLLGNDLGPLELCSRLLRSHSGRSGIKARQRLSDCHPGADIQEQFNNPSALVRAYDRELRRPDMTDGEDGHAIGILHPSHECGPCILMSRGFWRACAGLKRQNGQCDKKKGGLAHINCQKGWEDGHQSSRPPWG